MTEYEKVFKPFLRRIKDPIFGILTEELATDELISIMDAAILKFNYPKVDLKDKDDTLQQFNQDLGFDEIQILASLMVVEWLEPIINDVSLLKQTKTSPEYKSFSQANHITAIEKLHENMKKENKKTLIDYSKRDGNKSNLGKLVDGIENSNEV